MSPFPMPDARAIPATAGIGLRMPHKPAFAAEAATAPLTTPWLEIHSENYLCDGGPRLAMLDAIAARYPISCHGVGLSLGSAEGLSRDHLRRLAALFARVQPGLISEHLAWSVADGVYLNDLLPLPYTSESFDILLRNIETAQQAFGRQILIENPSAYLSFPTSDMDEPVFLNTLCARAGCGLLLDVNNVYVTCKNVGGDPRAYLDAIDAGTVGEIHLAGHTVEDGVLIDSHSRPVTREVWALYAHLIARIGPRPTLIEWDRDVPDRAVLLTQAAMAQRFMDDAAAKVIHVA